MKGKTRAFLGMAMALVVAVSTTTVSLAKEDYSYADQLNFSSDKLLNSNGIDEISDERLDSLLEMAKEDLLSKKDELESKGVTCNWEILDDIRIYYSSKFIDELGEERNPKGHYNHTKNAIEISILAKEYEISDKDLLETIAHETLHGLLGKYSIDEYMGSSIWEAFTEYLSMIVIEDYTPYYFEEIQILKMLFNIWGEKETISYLQEDKLIPELQKLTAEKYAKEAIIALDYFTELKASGMYVDTIEITQEIIANATANTLDSDKERFLDLLVVYEDIEHYKSILGIENVNE